MLHGLYIDLHFLARGLCVGQARVYMWDKVAILTFSRDACLWSSCCLLVDNREGVGFCLNSTEKQDSGCTMFTTHVAEHMHTAAHDTRCASVSDDVVEALLRRSARISWYSIRDAELALRSGGVGLRDGRTWRFLSNDKCLTPRT